MDRRVPFLACERAIIAGVNVDFRPGASTSSSTTRQKAEHAPALPIMHVRLPGHHLRRDVVLYRRHSPRQRTYIHLTSQRGSGRGRRRASLYSAGPARSWKDQMVVGGVDRRGETAFCVRCVRGARTDEAGVGSSHAVMLSALARRPHPRQCVRRVRRGVRFRELILRRPCLHFLGRATAWPRSFASRWRLPGFCLESLRFLGLSLQGVCKGYLGMC